MLKIRLQSPIMALLFAICLSAEANRITSYQYNAHNQVVAINGPRIDVSDTTTFTYYTDGNLETVTNALGHVTTYSDYNAFRHPGRVVDPNGVITEIDYDDQGRVILMRLSDPLSSALRETLYHYDVLGQLVSMTLPNGQVMQFEYDDLHNMIAMENAQGDRIEYTLDSARNRVREDYIRQEEIKKSVQFVHNELKQLVAIISGEGVTQSHVYDGKGRMVKSVDGELHETIMQYDALGRLITTIDADLTQTHYTYTEQGQIATVTDARQVVTEYEYNAFGDLIRQESPDTGVTLYEVDNAGNRTAQTDARGVRIEYVYDASGRLVHTHYPANPVLDVEYSYDEGDYGIGRLSRIVDVTGETQYHYDAFGQVVEKTRTLNGHSFTQSFVYDSNGQVIEETYPSGRVLTYQRDITGNITDVISSHVGVAEIIATNISYLPYGAADTWILGNGLIANRAFDQDYRVTGIHVPTLLGREYAYTPNGNISHVDDEVASGLSQQFHYDNRNRLIQAEGDYGLLEYDYDATGNRLGFFSPEGSVSYIYDADSNRLQSIVGAEFVEIDYDPVGNTAQSSARQFIYNEQNRLVEVRENNAPLVTYQHNALGQRVSKSLLGDATVYYLYSLAGQLIAELSSNGEIVREYLYLNGEPLALIAAAIGEGDSQVMDNTDASFSAHGSWQASTAIKGYEGNNYLHHPPHSGLNNATIIDNESIYFSAVGHWVYSAAVAGYEGSGYQHYFGPTISGGDIIDNTQGVATGAWSTSTAVNGFEGSDYQHHHGGDTDHAFTWPLASAAGEYRVYAKWTAHPNRASDASYRIHHNEGSTDITVNQRENGGQWYLLGTFTLDDSSQVVLSGQGNGYVIADAIQLVPVNAPAAAAIWQLDAQGTRHVYARWTAHPNRAADATYRVYHSEGSTDISVNQRENGGQWYLLGAFDLDGNSRVELSGEGSGYLIADAIALEDPDATPHQAIWSALVPATAEVKLYAKWTAHPNRASDATYRIYHVDGSTDITVNQRESGGQWYLLGTFTLDEYSQVSLAASATGHVIADALRVEIPSTANGPKQVYYYHNDHLGTPQLLTDQQQSVVWQGRYTPFGEVVELVNLVEQPLRFPGQYHDRETGLYYNYFRDYDPTLGRYVQSDPIGLEGGINTYAYVLGNPLSYVDPKGLAPLCPPGHRAVPADGYSREFPKIFKCEPYNSPRDPRAEHLDNIVDFTGCVLLGEFQTKVEAEVAKEAAKRTGKRIVVAAVNKAAKVMTGPVGFLYTLYDCSKEDDCEENK